MNKCVKTHKLVFKQFYDILIVFNGQIEGQVTITFKHVNITLLRVNRYEIGIN